MRNPKRLIPIYEQIAELHKNYNADLRIVQLFINFLGWHLQKYGTDGFYLEDKEFLKRFKEYMGE